MADTLATSFGVLNYSGMLFNKGTTRTPLSAIIGGRPGRSTLLAVTVPSLKSVRTLL